MSFSYCTYYYYYLPNDLEKSSNVAVCGVWVFSTSKNVYGFRRTVINIFVLNKLKPQLFLFHDQNCYLLYSDPKQFKSISIMVYSVDSVSNMPTTFHTYDISMRVIYGNVCSYLFHLKSLVSLQSYFYVIITYHNIYGCHTANIGHSILIPCGSIDPP